MFAHEVWSFLSSTIAGHAAIASLLQDLGHEPSLRAAQAHMAAVLAAMGTAARMLQGEPLPFDRLAADIRQIRESGGALHDALRTAPAQAQPLVERIAPIAAATTAVEARLSAALMGRPSPLTGGPTPAP